MEEEEEEEGDWWVVANNLLPMYPPPPITHTQILLYLGLFLVHPRKNYSVKTDSSTSSFNIASASSYASTSVKTRTSKVFDSNSSILISSGIGVNADKYNDTDKDNYEMIDYPTQI